MNMKMNNKGNVLQIVLILTCLLLFYITSNIQNYIDQIHAYERIDKLLIQKNLEIMLIDFYIQEMKYDILLSDSYSDHNVDIYYYVDDMGDYFIVDTFVNYDDMSYEFVVHIDTSNYNVLDYTYK